MTRILIVGSWGTTHIRRFLGVLYRSKPKDLLIEAYDPSLNYTTHFDVPVDKIYRIKKNRIEQRIFSIRKIGTFLFEKKKLVEFENIVKNQHYDLVNFHMVPRNANDYVRICHRHDIKIMLTPFGSDVLRVSSFYVHKLIRAFHDCDFVSANTITGFAQKLREQYEVSNDKIVNLGYGSETISSILEMKGKYNRQQLADMLGLPYSSCYIVCGYTASLAQRHALMIDAINNNKDLLPKDYCILIPLTYGTNKDQLKNELSILCERYGLHYQLLTDYLNNEQVAAIRLISNIFIHIQPTDAYNVSLQEFLLAGALCINGSWLEYPSLERFGKPYFACDSLENLSETLSDVLQNKAKKVPLHSDIINEITSNAWCSKIKNWVSFYSTL